MTRIVDTVIENCNYFMYTGYNFNPLLISFCGVIAFINAFMLVNIKPIQRQEC